MYSLHPATYDISQGTILGPIIYIIYLNDLLEIELAKLYNETVEYKECRK